MLTNYKGRRVARVIQKSWRYFSCRRTPRASPRPVSRAVMKPVLVLRSQVDRPDRSTTNRRLLRVVSVASPVSAAANRNPPGSSVLLSGRSLRRIRGASGHLRAAFRQNGPVTPQARCLQTPFFGRGGCFRTDPCTAGGRTTVCGRPYPGRVSPMEWAPFLQSSVVFR